jgi:hypothetical protein
VHPPVPLARRVVVSLACSGAVLLGALGQARAEPSATDKETARALLDEGDKAMEALNFAAALKAYAAADGLMHVPTTGVRVALAQAELGKLVEAKDTCLAVTRLPAATSEPASFVAARTRCTELVVRLSTRIPSLVIELAGLAPGASPTVTCDG